MSVQQAAIHGAKSHLGPYAVRHISGGDTHLVHQQRGIKKQASKLWMPGAREAASSSSKSELSLWESLIKGIWWQYHTTGCLIYRHCVIIGAGCSVWKRGQRRAVTPSPEHISRATFSSRGSRKPDVAITAECYEVDSSFHLMTS